MVTQVDRELRLIVMEKFWKAALGVAGLAAVAFFAFYSLYKQWLKLPIFPQLTQEQAYKLMVLFLVLTFVALIAGLIAWSVRGRTSFASGDEPTLQRLQTAWQNVNYIDCNSLIGPDVEKASNALQMTAQYWKRRYLPKDLISEQYGPVFVELFDQIDKCGDKPVPGYKAPVKYCRDFLSPLVRNACKQIKKYANAER